MSLLVVNNEPPIIRRYCLVAEAPQHTLNDNERYRFRPRIYPHGTLLWEGNFENYGVPVPLDTLPNRRGVPDDQHFYSHPIYSGYFSTLWDDNAGIWFYSFRNNEHRYYELMPIEVTILQNRWQQRLQLYNSGLSNYYGIRIRNVVPQHQTTNQYNLRSRIGAFSNQHNLRSRRSYSSSGPTTRISLPRWRQQLRLNPARRQNQINRPRAILPIPHELDLHYNNQEPIVVRVHHAYGLRAGPPTVNAGVLRALFVHSDILTSRLYLHELGIPSQQQFSPHPEYVGYYILENENDGIWFYYCYPGQPIEHRYYELLPHQIAWLKYKQEQQTIVNRPIIYRYLLENINFGAL